MSKLCVSKLCVCVRVVCEQVAWCVLELRVCVCESCV